MANLGGLWNKWCGRRCSAMLKSGVLPLHYARTLLLLYYTILILIHSLISLSNIFSKRYPQTSPRQNLLGWGWSVGHWDHSYSFIYTFNAPYGYSFVALLVQIVCQNPIECYSVVKRYGMGDFISSWFHKALFFSFWNILFNSFFLLHYYL